MAISISDYRVHLQDDLKLNREYLNSQGNPNEGQKVFDRDACKLSCGSLSFSSASNSCPLMIEAVKNFVSMGKNLF